MPKFGTNATAVDVGAIVVEVAVGSIVIGTGARVGGEAEFPTGCPRRTPR